MSEPKTLDDLQALYDCEWLESRGRLARVTTEPEQSAWYCLECNSLNVDSCEGICYDCEEDDHDDSL
jgi:hypothetical protein